MSGSTEGTRSLGEVRAEIEAMDAQIIGLVATRMRLVREVGAAKRATGQPVIDPAREAAVVARASELARQAGLPEDDVRALYRHLMAMARRVQLDGSPLPPHHLRDPGRRER